MPELIPFELQHLKKIEEYHEWDRKSINAIKISDREEFLLNRGPSWTVREGDTILACAGVNLLWGGVGEAWMLTSAKISRHRFYFYKTLKNTFLGLVRTFRLHRVQADVERDFKASCNMMKHLGFHEESTMLNYGPNKEIFVRYVFLP